MFQPSPVHRIRVLLVSLLLIGAASATLAFNGSSHGPGCMHAQGRLFNATQLGGTGRMIGTISGLYSYDGSTYQEWDPDGSDVIFNSGSSVVEGEHGSVTFQEYAALDKASGQSTNGAVLLVATGGTGRWEGASGHLALSGYFHGDPFGGQWDYEGEVCLP
jgi:hypothetical protein